MGMNSKIGKENEERTVFGILLTVSFCHLLDDTMHSMLPAIYPMLKEEFGLSFFQIGIITLVLQLTSSIIQPFVGLYADRHHGLVAIAREHGFYAHRYFHAVVCR